MLHTCYTVLSVYVPVACWEKMSLLWLTSRVAVSSGSACDIIPHSSWISFSGDWNLPNAWLCKLHVTLYRRHLDLYFNVRQRAFYSFDESQYTLLMTSVRNDGLVVRVGSTALLAICEQILVQNHQKAKLGFDVSDGCFCAAWALLLFEISTAGVLSRWHRSDCLIRSHSCAVPEPLSPPFSLLFSSLSLSCHPHLFAFTPLSLSLSLSSYPSLSLLLCLFDFFWSPPHFIKFSLPFNFNSWWPTLLLLSLSLLFSNLLSLLAVSWCSDGRLTGWWWLRWRGLAEV